MNANLGKGWTSHTITVIKACMASQGDVLELGAGPSSTSLLHWVCKEMGRKLTTYEDDQLYVDFARQFQSPLHRIRLIENNTTGWDAINNKKRYGLVFIDHGGRTKEGTPPGSRRGFDAIRFKDCADFIVLHDTDKPHLYGYDDVWKHFKYAYTWKESRPWTSVVSNFHNLEKFNETYKI